MIMRLWKALGTIKEVVTSIDEEGNLNWEGYTVYRTNDIHKIRNVEALVCFCHLMMVSQIVRQKVDRKSIPELLKGWTKFSDKEIKKHMDYLYALDLQGIKEHIEEN
jgi:hypothetical protein